MKTEVEEEMKEDEGEDEVEEVVILTLTIMQIWSRA